MDFALFFFPLFTFVHLYFARQNVLGTLCARLS